MPTLDEINDAAPDTPVFILHLVRPRLLNRAALKVVGCTKDTPNPPGGDPATTPTATDRDADCPSERHDPLRHAGERDRSCRWAAGQLRASSCELEPPGLTSAIDAGGGFPELPGRLRGDCRAAREKQMTIPHRLQPVYPASGPRAGRL